MACRLGSVWHEVFSNPGSAIAFLLVLFTFTPSAQSDVIADRSIPYYSAGFYQRVLSGERDAELIKDLRAILSKTHQSHPGRMDEIVDHCSGSGCYRHEAMGYKQARKALFGSIYLVSDSRGYAIEEVYCQKDYGRDDFHKGPKPGPGVIVDHTILNAEHTWPQSRFNRNKSKEDQKSDLHHLFPSDSEMNSIRGNMKFGEVDRPAYQLPCSTSEMGGISGHRGDYFEPPQTHKGNVARALFYFSVRYSIPIDDDEEAFLREWHRNDPPTDEDVHRNETIFRLQGNRNPFIDFPELPDLISNF